MSPKNLNKHSKSAKMSEDTEVQEQNILFLKIYQKPTQIYRYLRTRNMISPIFLQRTLGYMKHRLSRTNKRPKNFKIESLLFEVVKKNNKSRNIDFGEYLTLRFAALYDNAIYGFRKNQMARVDAFIIRISHIKCEDNLPLFLKIGSTEVFINPCEIHENNVTAAICVPTESFMPETDLTNTSYILYLKMEKLPGTSNTTQNGEVLEPPARRFKPNPKFYGAQLAIADKNNQCLLKGGEYQINLTKISSTNNIPQYESNCQTLSQHLKLEVSESGNGIIEAFKKNPSLILEVRWQKKTDIKYLKTNNNKKENITNHNNNTIVSPKNVIKGPAMNHKPNNFQVIFYFNFNKNSSMHMETYQQNNCPWCHLDCIKLYSLLKHLKLCHARFKFTYSSIPEGARIDVAINNAYDGPPSLFSPPKKKYLKKSSNYKIDLDNVLVYRPRRKKPSLSEFLDESEKQNHQKSNVSEQERKYYHSGTCLPILSDEFDIDSEEENDPLWLQEKTKQMLDDFTDVNDGEKEIMKMWNLHVMKHRIIGDCQIPNACHMFVEIHGREIFKRNLYRNFLLHLCTLEDHSLISPKQAYEVTLKLQGILKTYPEGLEALQKSREAQLDYWLKVGIHKEAEKENQSKQKNNNQNSPKKSYESNKSNRDPNKLLYSPKPSTSKEQHCNFFDKIPDSNNRQTHYDFYSSFSDTSDSSPESPSKFSFKSQRKSDQKFSNTSNTTQHKAMRKRMRVPSKTDEIH